MEILVAWTILTHSGLGDYLLVITLDGLLSWRPNVASSAALCGLLASVSCDGWYRVSGIPQSQRGHLQLSYELVPPVQFRHQRNYETGILAKVRS